MRFLCMYLGKILNGEWNLQRTTLLDSIINIMEFDEGHLVKLRPEGILLNESRVGGLTADTLKFHDIIQLRLKNFGNHNIS